MCCGPHQLNSSITDPSSSHHMERQREDMNNPTKTVETMESSFSSLLELAANNNMDGFKQSIEDKNSLIDEIGLWYSRQKPLSRMVLERRTPLMVAAMYGSVDVLKLILSLSKIDVNRSCGSDKSTALHCAASGGSVNSVDVVKLLLLAGANTNLVDAKGHRPFDLIVFPSKLPEIKFALLDLLQYNDCLHQQNMQVSSPSLSSYPDSKSSKFTDINLMEKKEYPIDPFFPDIKNSIYTSDEFRMFQFKIRPCSRAYSHDWTECPFVHPGENARRRDPRKFHYSCVPCPEFRKGTCRRGDLCEYAHGVFECWLHPAQYRTRLCKDGSCCNRRVCFFAHAAEELRPLYVSTSSAPSPRSVPSMDMASAMSVLPGSPSAASAMSPSPFTPISPSRVWPQPNIPMLHLPSSNIQTSRLRSSSNPRNIHGEEFLNDLSCFSQPHSPAVTLSLRTLTPSNLDELFSAEVASPWIADQLVFSPSHKSMVMNQFQQQQSVLSPETMDHPLLQASFRVEGLSSMDSSCLSTLTPSQKNQHGQLRSLRSRELGANSGGKVESSVNSWLKLESTNWKPDWSIHGNELGHVRKSCTLGNNGYEPDISWVQSLVKESPSEIKETLKVHQMIEGSKSNSQIESIDHAVLGA